MIDSNRRIFLAIFLSLLITFSCSSFFKNPQSLRPANIYAGIVQKTEEIKTKILSIKFPSFSKLFTLQFNPKNSNETVKQSNNQSNNSFNLPTAELQPTNQQVPTGTWQPAPTLPHQNPTIGGVTAVPIPTVKPKPTLKPTKPPKPTDIPAPPPVTSNTRPGTTLGEIFDNVSKRMCVPAALFRAFQEGETGAWFHFDTDPTPYNTYGWWTTAGPDPCRGFGYDAKTGYVPSDSYYANRFCMITPGANPGIMGLFAIDQWEQDVSRKNTVAILPNNIDRRVIFDSTVIFASITVNRVGSNELPACGEQWSDTAVNIAAAKHVSGTYPCLNPTCKEYSRGVLERYKQYR